MLQCGMPTKITKTKKVIRPHDPLSRKFLSNLKIAKEFISIHLTPTLLEKCVLNSLRIEPGSYVEDNLKAHYSDIVYRLDLKDNKGSAYVYTLLEHQSRAEELMPLRIIKYQLAIIQKYLDMHKKATKLPIVAAIVFYNGEDSPYPYTLDISDIFADSETYKKFPLGTFQLVDLTVTEDATILQHGKLALLEIVMKHIRERDFNMVINSIIAAIKFWQEKELDHSLLSSIFHYIMSSREVEDVMQLIEHINQELPALKENIMTYADELIKKGKQEGIQLGKQEGIQIGEKKGIQIGEKKGKQEAKLEIARELLKLGVDKQIILSTTHLTMEELLKLQQNQKMN